jgi:hypothetical protein
MRKAVKNKIETRKKDTLIGFSDLNLTEMRKKEMSWEQAKIQEHTLNDPGSQTHT